MNRSKLAVACAAISVLAFMTACSTPAPGPKEAEPPPEPLTGETALFRMYQNARSTWAHDVMVESMTSVAVNGVPAPPPGQAIEWQAVLFSPAASESRSYTDSIVEQLPDLHKGVFAGPRQSPSGSSFLIAAVKTDSDAAYKAAIGKLTPAERTHIEGKPLLILLELDRRYSDPVWRIVWGESVSTAVLSVFVNATSGEYASTMH